MSTLTTRAGKGAELTWDEIDTNLANLNNDKIEASQVSTLTNKTIALGSNTVSGTLAQFNGALTDADFATGGGTATGTNTGDQTTITGNAGTATALSAGAGVPEPSGLAFQDRPGHIQGRRADVRVAAVAWGQFMTW